MFDEMTPSIIMAGFPMLDWIDIAMSPVCLPGEVDQNANIMYVDAAERMGLAADVCPLPSAEVDVRSWMIIRRWGVLLLQVPCRVTVPLVLHCLWIVI